jgi:hypothetical protein
MDPLKSVKDQIKKKYVFVSISGRQLKLKNIFCVATHQ